MPRIVAVVNQKGGVGKTTTAVSLASALAAAERRVLLVDMDPQGNATSGVWPDRNTLGPPTVYEVLLEGSPVSDACRATPLPFLSLLPGHPDLVGAELDLVGRTNRETCFLIAIQAVADKFDYILVDCPPSLGLLTLNALVAAHAALIPLQCEYYALEGLAQLTKTLELVRVRANATLEIEGIVFTMYDGRTSLAAQVRGEVERYFKEHVFTTVIPRSVRLTEAPSHGRSIVQYDLRSPGAVAYLELAKEVLSRDEARARTGSRRLTSVH